jgi:hypothetical protein
MSSWAGIRANRSSPTHTCRGTTSGTAAGGSGVKPNARETVPDPRLSNYVTFTDCVVSSPPAQAEPGAPLDAANVRKMFKRVCTAAGTGDGWTPRELRTSFVSLLSYRGVSIEEIARLVGHASTRTTEIVYRRELRPVITTRAEIMDELFKES